MLMAFILIALKILFKKHSLTFTQICKNPQESVDLAKDQWGK